MMTNEDLMFAYQKGDAEAFNKLYNQLYKPLYSFLFRYTGEEQLSIDIVQDTFEQLQKSGKILMCKRAL